MDVAPERWPKQSEVELSLSSVKFEPFEEPQQDQEVQSAQRNRKNPMYPIPNHTGGLKIGISHNFRGFHSSYPQKRVI